MKLGRIFSFFKRFAAPTPTPVSSTLIDLPSPAQVAIQTPHEPAPDWYEALLTVQPQSVSIRPTFAQHRPPFTFNPANIRWIGALQPHTKTICQMAFDLESRGQWYTLHLRLPEADLKRLAELLEKLAPPLLAGQTPRRANVRHKPVPARIISASEQFVELYITPLWLVIFKGGQVWRRIAVSTIDSPNAEAAEVSFTVLRDGQTELFAFALDHAAAFAANLAAAIDHPEDAP